MKGNRKKLAFNGILFGMINKFIHLLVPFIIFVAIKNNLGAEFLGLNNLFSSLLQMLSLAELGFGSALVYEMYKPIAENDKNKVSCLLNFYKKTYQILAFVIFIIGILCLPFLQHMINGSVPDSINIYVLFGIYLFNTIISYFLFAYKKSLLQANQRNDIINKINSIVNVIIYAIQFIILIVFKNYYVYIITLPISTIVDNIIVQCVTKKLYPDIVPNGELSDEEKKKISSRVKALAGHKIGGVVINSFDSIIISSFLGLTALALYSNYFYIIKSLSGILNIGYTSLLPGIGNSLVTEDNNHNYILFNKLTILICWIVGLFSICLIVLFQPFMQIWMGSEYLLPFITVCLFVVYFYVWQFRIIGLAFKDAAGMWKEDFWKPYVGLIFNLVFSIVLAKFIGINGVIIATIFVMAFIYFPWETRVIFKKIFKKSSKSYYLMILKHTLITIASGCVTLYISNFIIIDGILGMLVKGVLCMIFINAIYLISYKNNEHCRLLINDLKKVLKR